MSGTGRASELSQAPTKYHGNVLSGQTGMCYSIQSMRSIRLLSALAVICFQASCAAVQAPARMAGTLLRAVGRPFHLSSENIIKPGDFNVESREAKEAVVLNTPKAPEPEITGPMIAQQ